MSADPSLYAAVSLKEEADRFKQTFDDLLLTYIKAQRQYFATISSNQNLEAIFSQLEAVCADGKRLRPFMVATLYAHAKPDARLADIHHILLAVELLHIFCLIHDDIMDEAPTRRGVATIHQFTNSSLYSYHPQGPRSSDSQAILVGDIVFNMVFKLLHTPLATPLHTLSTVQEIFHTMIDEVCVGQMLDIDLTMQKTTTEAALTEKNRLKTAYYSFVRPLHIGAVLSDRLDLIPFIMDFGEAAGQLYQTEDDLLDIIGDEAVTKKTTFQDIAQNQHSVATTFVRSQGGNTATLLDSKVGQLLGDEEKRELKAAFITSGAISHAHALAAQYGEQAATATIRHSLTVSEQRLFSAILALVTLRTT